MSRTDWGREIRTRTALIRTRECWCRTTGAWVWLRSPRDRWAWRWRCLRPLVSHVYRTLLQLRPTSRGCKPHSYNSSIQVPNIRWFSLGNKFLNYSRINFIIHIHVGSVLDPDLDPGSAWILMFLTTWIRIRILKKYADPNYLFYLFIYKPVKMAGLAEFKQFGSNVSIS